jgi:phage terminase small subunit
MSRPVPPHLKVLAGTDRKDRASISEIQIEEPICEIPPPPLWLNNHGIKEWLRLAPILIEKELLTDGSLSALAQLCALHGNIVQMYCAQVVPNAAMLGTLRNMMNDFGLTPASQGKVKGAPTGTPDEKPKNRFSSVGKRPKE